MSSNMLKIINNECVLYTMNTYISAYFCEGNKVIFAIKLLNKFESFLFRSRLFYETPLSCLFVFYILTECNSFLNIP